MTGFIYWLVVTGVLFGVALALAYRREDLRTSTLTFGVALFVYSLISGSWLLWLVILWLLLAGMIALNFEDFRRERVTAPLLRRYRTMVPEMSTPRCSSSSSRSFAERRSFLRRND